MKQAHGHMLGKALIFAACGCFAFVVSLSDTTNDDNAWVYLIATGVLLAASGAYFLTKLYMDDPEAVAEYKRKMQKQPMKQNFKDYGPVANMLRIMSFDELKQMIDTDLGSDRLSPFLSQLGFAALKDLYKNDLYSIDDLRRMFVAEMKFHQTFTSLWGNGLVGEMPRLMTELEVGSGQQSKDGGSGVVDVEKCRALLFKEYDWVDEHGNPQASAPDAETSATSPTGGGGGGDISNVPGGVIGVFPALLQYAPFAMKHLDVKRSYFVAVAETCDFAAKHSLRELVREGAIELGKQRLLSVSFFDKKFQETLDTERRSASKNISSSGGFLSTPPSGPQVTFEGDSQLWVVEDHVKLHRLLTHSLITPELAAPLFFSAIPTQQLPTRPNNTVNKQTHIIPFLEYWKAPLELHGAVLVPGAWQQPLRHAWHEWKAAQEELEKLRRNALIQNRKTQLAGPEQRAQMHTVEKQINSEFDNRRHEQLIRVHQEFALSVPPLAGAMNDASLAAAATCQPM